MKYSSTTGPGTLSLNTLLDLIPDAVVVVDRDGLIAAFNARAEELFGYFRGEVVGTAIEPCLVPCGSGAGISMYERRAASPADWMECRALRRDGSEVPVEVSCNDVPGDNDALAIAVIRDITQRKLVETQLRQAHTALIASNEGRDRFLAHLGHELRTPLGAIISYTALMLEDTGALSREQARRLSIVRNCGQQMLLLSDELFDWARAGAGGVCLHIEQIDVGAVMSELHATLLPRAQDKGLRFGFVEPMPPLVVSTDLQALRQILMNLIVNAIKYTDQGSVRLWAEAIEHRVHLNISDTGVGIAPADRCRLFQDFTQIGDRSCRRDGAGIGLSLCARLAKLVGARIDLESEPGSGSVFTLMLPLT